MALIDALFPEQSRDAQKAFAPIEKKELAWPGEIPPDTAILKRVIQDINQSEHYIYTRGWPTEWLRYERLYLFQVPIQFWEGTQIPRAHLGVPLVYEHVESTLPQVMLGLFSDVPPFESRPYPGTSEDAARANDALLAWELKRSNFREELRLGVKSALIYGTGIWKWGWKRETRTRVRKVRKGPARIGVTNADLGLATPDATQITVPNPESEVENETYEEQVSLPTFEHIHIRHVLFDAGLRVPDIRKAKWVAHRLYMTPLQLDSLRDEEGYEIPPREVLAELAMPPKEMPVQSSLEVSPLDVGQDFMPATNLWGYRATPRPQETTADPLQLPLEVVEYWTRDHVFTVVQRKLVIRKEHNVFGEIPFCSLVLGDLPDSFYGVGYAKLIGNEQRLQQGVLNTFLDDLSLCLNTPFIRVRGANVPTQQLRMRPGGVIDTDTKDGIGVLEREPLAMETFSVLAASDQRAQRHTGAMDMAVQGVMPTEKSSVTRTATGVNMLSSGSGSRMQYLIENIAAQVFVPTLVAYHKMNALYLEPERLESILSNELNVAYKGDPIELVNAQVDFDILAASKLQSRRAMAQSLPLLFQFLLTEPVMQGLQVEGKKVNIAELASMLFDVSGWPNKQNVIVDMTPEDKQSALMQNPAVQQMMAQQAAGAQKLDAQKQVIEEQNIARAGRDVIRELMKKAEGPEVGLDSL